MREIKFRGRRVDNGEFIYGDLLTGDGDFAIISDTWRACVEPDSVEQLIGHDSNGREVYDGDKITDKAGNIWFAKSKGYAIYESGCEGTLLVIWTS